MRIALVVLNTFLGLTALLGGSAIASARSGLASVHAPRGPESGRRSSIYQPVELDGNTPVGIDRGSPRGLVVDLGDVTTPVRLVALG
jgi:hypothetical protein